MTNPQKQPFSLTPIMIVLITLLMMTLAYLGGEPKAVSSVLFIVGILVMLGVGMLIGFATWFLLFRDLPDNYAVAEKTLLAPLHRQMIGLMLVVAMSLATIGGVWDEFWHQTYGIPFGEDLFWRPHLMIYTGMLITIVVAAYTLILILRTGKGSFAQRFRTDKLLGLVVMVGAFFVYALPADPIWHMIYGSDITSFSIPHVLIATALVLTQTLGAGIVLSSDTLDAWQGIWKMRMSFVVPLIAFAFSTMTIIMTFVTNYTWITDSAIQARDDHIFAIPIWFLPFLLTAIPTLFGTLAVHSLRRAGAATGMIILCLITRYIISSGMGFENGTILPWISFLPVAIGIDIAAFIQLGRRKTPHWWTSAFGTILMFPITLWVMQQFFRYPSVTLSSLLPLSVIPLLIAFIAAWVGSNAGDYFASQQKGFVQKQGASARQLAGVAIAAYVILLLFTVAYFASATPPIT